ncbi:MAG: Mut7-C RNAse domain-containing protein [Nitrospirae bacterium]|nr:Mut7-C RNAse domain-containing protein [Nitrospirota bacterium]
MVGKLARWLRILGYDTLYFREIDNGRLLELARAEGRRLLTRDARLTGRLPDIPHTLIRDDRPELQLRQIVREFRLSPSAGLLTRCLECNTPLEPFPREQAESLVPPYVFRTQKRFSHCPNCGRLYWKGTHEEHIRTKLKELFGD